jgi:hypothetical protein
MILMPSTQQSLLVYIILYRYMFRPSIGHPHVFLTKYTELCKAITNGNTSKYAQHILDNPHDDDNIQETMKILHVTKKGKMLDAQENYYIYKITKQGMQINDVATNTYNPIHEFMYEHTKTDPI